MSFGSAISRPLPSAPGRRSPHGVVLLFAALAALSAHSSLGQSPGSLDPTFLSQFTGSTVYAILPNVDVDTLDVNGNAVGVLNTLVVGGDADGFNRVLLFNPPTLLVPSGALRPDDVVPNFGDGSRIVYTIVADKFSSDPSRYFVGGTFGKSSTQLFPKRNILRILSKRTSDPVADNGTIPIDLTFDPGTGANDYVTSILPTADHKLVVGGLFDSFNGSARNHIVRLNDDGTADGSIDLTFDPALNIDNNVLALAEQLDPVTSLPNGQVLVAGLFNQINGRPATKLARLNHDGTVDLTFAPVIDERVNAIAVQPNGKILIGGDFKLVDGVAVQKIARLNFDGSYDSTFAAVVNDVPTDNVNVVAVNTINLLSDGRMFVGGNFIKVNGLTRQYLALLLADGSVDLSFDPGLNIINSVQSLVADTTLGEVYVGETISRKVNNVFPASLIGLYGVTILPLTPASFFHGEFALGNNTYFLALAPSGNAFGYYSHLTDSHAIYHYDLGYEYVFDANDGFNGVYLYDYASNSFFYTSPSFPFPYLYDFSLDSVVYYYPDPANPGRYNTNGVRYFYVFNTGLTITK